MRVLVTGASGLLGRALMTACEDAGYDTHGTAFSRANAKVACVDLRESAEVDVLVQACKPDVVLHTAAERRPDVVERDADAVHRLNVALPAAMAKACAALHPPAYLVNLSTEYVFDGRSPPYNVDSPPNPLNAYGKSKRDAEIAVLEHGKRGFATNVRVPVLYGDTEYDGESAVNVLLGAIQPRDDASSKISMDAHARRFPTHVEDLARMLVQLCEIAQRRLRAAPPQPMPPTLHLAAKKGMSKYEMCCIMSRAWNDACGAQVTTATCLDPVYQVDAHASTQRPENCEMDTGDAEALGIDMTTVSFEEWWRSYLARRGPPRAAHRDAGLPSTDAAGQAAPTPVAANDDEVRYGQRSPTKARARAPAPAYQFNIHVGNPQRVSDRVSSHVEYTVRVTSNAPWFPRDTLSTLRRYSDFRWMHAALVQNHAGVIVPAIPEKVKIGNMAPALVELRRRSLEHALTKILEHPALRTDEDLMLFLQSQSLAADIKARDAKKGAVVTPEQKTYMGWSHSLQALRFRETDEWFKQQELFLGQLEKHMQHIVHSVMHLAQKRQALASKQDHLYKVLVALSSSTLSRHVSTSFGALSEMKKRAAEASEVLADHEANVLGLVLYEYERLVGNVRKAFATRVELWQAWQRAEEDLTKQRHRQRTNPAAHMDLQINALSHAELQAATLHTRFDDVTELCKKEFQRFEQEKALDVRAALENYMQAYQRIQQEILEEWAHCEAIVQRHAPPPTEASTIPLIMMDQTFA
ncbi:Vacuolar protein sorting-associated protein vps5 [Malassezia vespertilionis]|uniref:Vacuolar protein sorting-associated protein vps5 n=1 Tax=Malassezia vespertilionis TaxID=2020962 RepID=UPI0024B269CA|nr:Vacuolar protein sorting-associated protein vps5 [Malassezia vespertilionis]WFD06596.1 Vacuolar protein sorting-associated protein vps5 [Malassezia vespertilionis]